MSVELRLKTKVTSVTNNNSQRDWNESIRKKQLNFASTEDLKLSKNSPQKVWILMFLVERKS